MDKSRIALTLGVAATVIAAGVAVLVVRGRYTNAGSAAAEMQADIQAARLRGGSGPATARLLKLGAASEDAQPTAESDFEFVFGLLSDTEFQSQEEARRVGTTVPKSLDSTDQLVLQRHALVVLAALIRNEGSEGKHAQRFVDEVRRFLSSDQWRLRQRAILSLHEADLLGQPPVRSLVEAMTRDEDERVVAAARRVLEN